MLKILKKLDGPEMSNASIEEILDFLDLQASDRYCTICPYDYQMCIYVHVRSSNPWMMF